MQYYYPVFDDLNKTENHQIIIDILEKAIIPNIPNFSILHFDLVANGYKQAKQYRKSAEWCEKVMAVSSSVEQKYAARFNMVQLYISCNQPEKALKLADMNLAINPNDWEMIIQRAICLFSVGQKEQARQIYIDMCKDPAKWPDKAIQSAKFNLGLHYITAGQFKAGMKLLQIGREMKIWGSNVHKYPIPRWDGKAHPGKSVIIVGEGGIGDEIINARFHKHIRDMGMIPHIASCHESASIFKRMGFESARNYKAFTTDVPDIADFDFWTPTMDLPTDMELDFKDLWYGPYLTVDPEYDEKWKKILPKSDKLKVGLKWMGNPLYEQELHRTVPITKFVPLFDLDKYELISLQKEHATDLDNNPHVQHHNEEFQTLEDLIAAINQLDIVLTSCTSIGHIAAAMGKTTYICVPIMNYYVWAENGYKSSWYGDNLTLLRQTKPREWDSAVKQLKGYIDGKVDPKTDI